MQAVAWSIQCNWHRRRRSAARESSYQHSPSILPAALPFMVAMRGCCGHGGKDVGVMGYGQLREDGGEGGSDADRAGADGSAAGERRGAGWVPGSCDLQCGVVDWPVPTLATGFGCRPGSVVDGQGPNSPAAIGATGVQRLLQTMLRRTCQGGQYASCFDIRRRAHARFVVGSKATSRLQGSFASRNTPKSNEPLRNQAIEKASSSF